MEIFGIAAFVLVSAMLTSLLRQYLPAYATVCLTLCAVLLLGRILVPAAEDALLGPAFVVVYVTMVAPLLIMMLGFVYAVGCAGVDKSKRGPFARYLPEDHFDD